MPRPIHISLLLLIFSVSLGAADYPSRSIRIIVPFGPGGPSDILARTVGQKLTEAWGQQVVIDNRPGANGVVGSELAARSAPDGYTLVMGTNGTHGINASLYPKLPYDTVRDFAPITRVGLAPYMLVAHPSLPARSVIELIKFARARPGEIIWASGGSPSQLAAELFKRTARIDALVVLYRGSAPAVIAVLSGEASLVFGGIAQSATHARAGRLRALGVASLSRSPVMPEVPTIAESGLPGFEASAWYGLLAPGGTPRAIVDRLFGEIIGIMQSAAVRERLRGEAYELPIDTPDQFAAVIRAELAKWAPIVKDAGLRPD